MVPTTQYLTYYLYSTIIAVPLQLEERKYFTAGHTGEKQFDKICLLDWWWWWGGPLATEGSAKTPPYTVMLTLSQGEQK